MPVKMDGISVLCAANRHPRMLAEVVEGFLRQECEIPHEMIILNDEPGSRLICNARDVTTVNAEARFATPADKYTEMIFLARYSHVCFWDEGGLYLPNHLATMVSRLQPPWHMSLGNGYVVDGDGNLSMDLAVLGNALIEAAFLLSAGAFRDADLFGRLLAKKGLQGRGVDIDSPPTYVQRAPTTDDGQEMPVGTIVITPTWHKDYSAWISSAPRTFSATS